MLKHLAQKCKLGVIANQNHGVNERLKKYEILSFFNLIVSSAEAGFAKSDPEVFLHALYYFSILL